MAKEEVARQRLARQKDQADRLLTQLDDVRRAASAQMLVLLEMGVTKSELAELWRTSRRHVDRMLARGRSGL